MKRTARTLLALAVVLAFIATFTGFSYAQARITQQIDDSQAVRLARNTRPEANFKNDRGPVSDGFNAEHMFLLLKRSPEKEKELDQLIDSLNDRKSPNFHKWLTPEEFGERFGVAQDDIDKITGWLEYHGFRVNQVYTNRILIDFSGTAGQLREAFHTEIHQLDVNGQHHVANMGDPQIPAALAPVVKGINSLNDFRPEAMHRAVRRDYTFGGCSTSTQPTFAGTCYSITPQDDAVIYNLNPLWAAGITGAGQTVAVVEDTDTYSGTADWSTYVTTFGLSGYGGTYTQVHPNCADPGTNADDSEAALDVEMASTSAPGAAVWNLACPSGAFTFGGQIALQNLINGAGPYPIVSMSYGEPETVNGNGNNAVFYATFQQAAAQGVSVFVSSGDNGPMSNEYYSNVEVSGTLGVTGWGETPYNVSVGGTDFEEVYNSKTGGAALSTYWNATNTASYGSALSYIPEMPWDNSCANAMIGKIRANTFTPYGTSGSCAGSVSGTDTFTDNGASAGGPSNCATGVNGLNQSNDAATGTDCQGYPKPSWQSAYGVPADSLRDIPDVSLFAANGSWSHSQVICWSDPSYTSDGSATCSGAPSTWSGFGGTSVATPLMAGMQALVNQKTAETWGNPNTVYYQIAQGEYGTQGGSYIGSSCNSSRSGGPASSCVFNDVTQGDIQQACSPAYNPFGATSIRNYCYGYTTNGSAFGATSTDSVSGTNYTIINGGKGYTTTNLPTCTIAGPSNKAAYLSPTGSTLYGGGTQATCTVVSGNVSTSSTTAVWTVRVAQSPDGCGYDSGTGLCDTANAWPVWGNGQVSVVVAGTTYTFFSSLSGVSTPNAVLEYTSSTAENSIGGFAYPTNALNTSKNLYAAITNNSANCASVAPCFANVSAANANATATYSSSGTTNGNITVTSRTAGYSGNFSVSWGPDDAEPEIIQITQTTAGQGPGYISGITIGTAGVGYGLQTPVTISGGPAGAIAPVIVANTSTAVAVSYQPAFGAANGYDLASGLGSVNAYNLACNSAWTGSATNCTTTAVSSSLNPSAYGTGVSFTATVTGNSPTGTVQFVIDGTNFGSPVALSGGSATSASTSSLAVGTHTVKAVYSGNSHNLGSSGTLSPVQTVNKATSATAVSSSLNPSVYGQAVNFTANVTGVSPTGTVQFVVDSVNFGSPVTLSGGSATSGNTSTLTVGTHTVAANYSGDSNNLASSGSLSPLQTVTSATAGVSVVCTPNPSTYAGSVVCTATISGQYGLVKGRNKKPMIVTGSVTWSANTGCGTTPVTAGTPGTASCTTTILPGGTDTIEADYLGDANHQPGSGTTSQVVNPGTSSIAVTSVSPNTEVYGQDAPATITAVLSWTGSAAPTGAVTIGGTGTSGYSATTCGAPSGSTMTCTATYTPTVADGVGSYTESATFAGDGNYNGSSSTQSNNFTITGATAATVVTSNLNPSLYNQSVTLTATINGQYNLVKGRRNTKGKPLDVSGTVAWTSNGVGIAGCNSTTVATGNPGVATCTTSALAVGTDAIEADYSGDSNHSPSSGTLSQVVNSPVTTTAVTNVSPAAEDFGLDAPVTITAVLSWTGNGPTPTGAVTISGNGPSGYSATSCGAASSNTITCTATYTPTAADVAGSYTESATYAGDSNYNGSSSTQSNNFAINSATSTTTVTSAPPTSTYGQSVTFTATIAGENGMVKGKKQSKKPHDVTGNVTWSGNTGCSVSVVSGYPGVATCTTSGLAVGSDTVTATYAGDANHGGSAGSDVQNVTGGQATSIAVTNVSPAAEDYNLDSPVTITAVLSWTGAGAAPTGAVTIGGNGPSAYSATTCGAASGNTITCTATYTPTGADVVGSYTETATFAGDSDYAGSSSTQTNNFAITQASTTTSVLGSPNPSTYAASVTFTATINAENNLARRNSKRKPLDVTGNVTWSSNTGCTTTAVTPAVGTGVGTATCTTSAATHLPVGTDVVTATYNGDSNHSGSTGSENQVVQGGLPTTIHVTSVSPAAEDFGANSPATITAVLSWTGNGVAPTGSDVTISGNGNGTYGATSCAARVHKTITCTATYTPNNADVAGSYTETASFSGDTNYNPSSSPETNNFTIGAATSTTSVVGNPNPSVYATSVTFTATITGENGLVKGNKSKKPLNVTGTVAWSANTGCSPSTVSGGYPGVATCTTSSATHLPVGANTVTATYSGDSNHSGSTGTMTQNVTGGIATSINVTSVSPVAEDYAADAPATITAVLSWTGNGVAPTASDVTIGGNGNGTYGATSCAPRVHESITCTATYTPSAADVAGSYTETAAFSGDSNYSGSTSPQTNNFAITAATSTTAVTSGLNPSTYGGAVTFTATVDGENGAARRNAKRKPLNVTGTVTWSANTGCSASTVSGYPGVATCTTSSLLGGTDTVSATYAGDSNHSGSSGSVSQVVNPASQTITCSPLPGSATYNTSFTASCSASSSLPISYTSAGGCTNSGATYTMTSGTTACLVTASQGGNGNYSAATPVNKSVAATLAPQSITVTTAAPPNAIDGSVFTIVASATSGLAITYTSAGACTNTGATYTINATKGTCTVRMTQGGNTNYSAATPVVETTTVKAAKKPVVSFTGMPTKAAYGATFTVTASSNEAGSYVSIPTLTTSTPSVCSVSGITTSGSSVSATVTMLTGTLECDVTAQWTANYVYAAAHVTKHTLAERATPAVHFTGAPATITHGNTFTVDATSNESGSLVSVPTITTTTATVCTVGTVTPDGSGGYQATVTTIKAGTCTTKAAWALNGDYASTSATQSTTVN